MLSTIALVTVASVVLGLSYQTSVFLGMICALSSTAIVLKVLQDTGETASPHGRNMLAILIFQDLIVVPMMLMVPYLGQGSEDHPQAGYLYLPLKIIAVLGGSWLGAKFLVPRIMHEIAKLKSKELFLLSTIAICFLVAFATAELGLSLALGAFLAGLIISESEFSPQATTNILPFRELFASFFFISVGMMLDLSYLQSHLWEVLLAAVALFLAKSFLASLSVPVLSYPPRTFLLTGFGLFQIGEFAYILIEEGQKYQLVSEEMYHFVVAVSIITMFVTPFVMMGSKKMQAVLMKVPFLMKMYGKTTELANKLLHTNKAMELSEHMIIIGYGINGSNLAKAANFASIPYVAIELNAETVVQKKKKGVPILFGDATQEHILELANIEKAGAIVVAISVPVATKLVVKAVRILRPDVYLVVRIRI